MFNQLQKSDTYLSEEKECSDDQIAQIRRLLHQRLIDSIELEGPQILDSSDNIKAEIGWMLSGLEEANGIWFSAIEKRQLESEILVELDGLGPLAPLMMNNDISDILVNGPSDIWVDKKGMLQKTDITFDDETHLRRFLDRLLAAQGRSLNSSNPMVDAKLADGSRVHAIIPPLCNLGAVISIRKFQCNELEMDELLEQGFMSKEMLALLKLSVESGLNIVISGGASAGKTTLINQLSSYIPDNDRVITIEETAELKLQNAHVIPLEGRNENAEGKGGVSLRDLLRTALRMRADRIIVGEVRSTEVFDMLQAMNVGHDGSMTTVHANSPQDVLGRIETLALTSGSNLTRESIQGMIGSAIHLIVQLTRFRDGSRCVTSISEVISPEGKLQANELFRYKAGDQLSKDCRHRFLGNQISFIQQIEQRGFDTSGLREALKFSA